MMDMEKKNKSASTVMSEPPEGHVRESTLLALESPNAVDEAVPDGQLHGWRLYAVQFW